MRLGNKILLNQATYTSKLQILNLDCTLEQFRVQRHEIACLTHKRPDLCTAVALLSRITGAKFESRYIKLAKQTVKMANEVEERGLRKRKLNRLSLILIAFSRASFTNFDDIGTQLGFIILLRDKTGKASWLT